MTFLEVWKDVVWFIFIILYGLVAFNCVYILKLRQSPASTLAWILLHVVLPFIAVPLFYILGENRIRKFSKRKQKRSLEFAGYVKALSSNKLDAQIRHAEAAGSQHLRSFNQLFTKFGDVFQPYQNHVQLLIDGETTFTAIFEAIAAARCYILVQYYILRSDRLGIRLQELLIEKAKAGIPVFLLYDDMGSFWLSREYVKKLRKAGVNTARFLPIANLSRFFQINFRNHRKLVAVDGICAFTGGLNVGDEYYGKGSPDMYWRDTHLKVIGPAARQLEEVFIDDWFFAANKKIRLKISESVTKSPLVEQALQANRGHIAFTQVIPTGPTDREQLALLMFMHAITSASKRIWIATPYFVPDQTLLKALVLARWRGVDVHVLIPEESDSRLVQWVGISFAEELCRKGISVSTYQIGFLHSKTCLVDDSLSIVGTCNFDNRALFLNFETSLVVHDEAFARDVEAMFLNDFKYSKPLEIPDDGGFFDLHRLVTDAARLLAPLL